MLKIINNQLLFLLAICTLFSVNSVYAANVYAGFGMGQVSGEFDKKGISSLTLQKPTYDETDNGLKLYMGSLVNKNFGLELGFVDLGTLSAKSFLNTFEFEMSGITLQAYGNFPVNDKLNLALKGGVISWSSDFSICSLFCTTGGDEGSDIAYGLGAHYQFTKLFGLRAGYDIYAIDQEEAGTGNFNVLSIDAHFVF